jgi:hypothetical protein
MEEISTSETSVYSTQRYTPEGLYLHGSHSWIHCLTKVTMVGNVTMAIKVHNLM